MGHDPKTLLQSGQWGSKDYRLPFFSTILFTNYQLFDTLSTFLFSEYLAQELDCQPNPNFHPPSHVPISTPGSGLPCYSWNWPIQCLPKERKRPRINLVFSRLVDGEHVKGHKSINSTLSFYLGGMTNCIQRPSFAQNRMSEKFACDNQNLGGLTTKTKHPQIKKTVN